MPAATVNVLLQDVKKLKTDALIVGFFEDRRPLFSLAGELDWLLCGALSQLIIDNKLRGSLGETALLTSRDKVPAPKIFLVGLGPFETVNASSLLTAAEGAVATAVQAGVLDVALECFSAPSLSWEAVLHALVQGADAGNRAGKAVVHLLAPDAARYELISKHLNHSPRPPEGPVTVGPHVGNPKTASNTDIRRM